ncbi:unnamed protein product [Clavelina lepadiformis]|uniref:IQ motif and ankyrin repeat domain-containing protein n=1 Tax=Clavelina lepadiformis TaxID=159417 RepID=A0ABP0EYP8_CLALP
MPPKRPPAKAAQKTTTANPRKPPGNAGNAKKSVTAAPGNKKQAAGKATAKGAKKEVKRGPTPEDLAAIKIQKHARGFLARKKIQKLKKQKQEYEDTIEKIQREAFIAMVKAEQEAAERELQREEEERKRKREEVKRRKRMLEAAFDGDISEMEGVLKEVSDLDNQNGVPSNEIGHIVRRCHQMAVVECQDAHDNTPLSEAASGGSVEAINFLIERGANPNTIGAWGRTPLYRAAFAGHMEAVESLLYYGADPRVYAQDGNTPEQVASVKQIVETLQNWDINITEALLEKMEAEKERRSEEDKKRKQAETEKLQDQLSEVQKVYDMKQRILEKCYAELEKRISEHDNAVSSGFDRLDVTLSTVKDAEGELEIAKLDAMKAREALEQAKLKLRDQEHGDQEELPGIKCNIRELDEVLMRDVGNRIKDSGKWPMIIDTTGQASTFLRYRDTNYVCALNPKDVEEERMRMSLIGAIRFGKPFVIDMLEVDMFATISDIFDNIHPGLMEDVMTKALLENSNYMKLIKPTDHDEYQKSKFQHHRVDNFTLIILTKNKYPSEHLIEKTYPIRIVLPEPRA